MTSPWADYPTGVEPEPEDYKPSGFEQAIGGSIIAFVCVLAMYGLIEILGHAYEMTGG